MPSRAEELMRWAPTLTAGMLPDDTGPWVSFYDARNIILKLEERLEALGTQPRRGLMNPTEPLRMQLQNAQNQLAAAKRENSELRSAQEPPRLQLGHEERVRAEALKLVGQWSAATAVVQGIRALAAWAVLASEGDFLDSALRFRLLELY